MHKVYFGNELYHHGVMGQKWGVRRYQNTDGSYKASAEGRYDPDSTETKKNSKFQQFKNRWKDRKQYEDDTAAIADRVGRYTQQKLQADTLKRTHKENQKLEKSPDRNYLLKNANKHYKSENLKSANREEAELAETRRMLNEYTNKYGKLKMSKVMINRNGVKEGLKAIKQYENDRTQRYTTKRESFKNDENKDLWERQISAKTNKERNAAINDRVRMAKETGEYEPEFLKRKDASLKGKALDNAYRKYLRNTPDY